MAVLSLVLWMGRALVADGIVRDSLGAISGGRGGTNLAFGDNLGLINDNPAGLSHVPGWRLDLGADLLRIEVEYEDPTNDTSAEENIFALPLAAVSWQALEAPTPVTLGVGLFIPAGFGVEYELDNDIFGNRKYEAESSLVKLLGSCAVELGGGLSLGASAGPAYEASRIEAPYTFQTGALQGVPALVELEADGVGVAWAVGLQWRIFPSWTVGLAYIGETRIGLEGSFDADLTGVLPAPDPTGRYRLELHKTWPRSLGAGTAYRFERAALSLDVVWFDWSSAMKDFAFDLKNGDNPAFDATAGPTPSDRFPLNWHDSLSIRLGAEYYLTRVDTLRAGYTYSTNPVPDDTLTPLLPATLQHGVTVGYGRRFGPVSLDVAYQFAFGSRHEVGESEILGGDFDDSSSVTRTHTVFLAASICF
jgi:long-chain fatty acid transport protein